MVKSILTRWVDSVPAEPTHLTLLPSRSLALRPGSAPFGRGPCQPLADFGALFRRQDLRDLLIGRDLAGQPGRLRFSQLLLERPDLLDVGAVGEEFRLELAPQPRFNRRTFSGWLFGLPDGLDRRLLLLCEVCAAQQGEIAPPASGAAPWPLLFGAPRGRLRSRKRICRKTEHAGHHHTQCESFQCWVSSRRSWSPVPSRPAKADHLVL